MSSENRDRARVAITLLEHAAGLLSAASNEGPKGRHSIGPEVANLNRNIERIQQRLFAVEDANEPS